MPLFGLEKNYNKLSKFLFLEVVRCIIILSLKKWVENCIIFILPDIFFSFPRKYFCYKFSTRPFVMVTYCGARKQSLKTEATFTSIFSSFKKIPFLTGHVEKHRCHLSLIVSSHNVNICSSWLLQESAASSGVRNSAAALSLCSQSPGGVCLFEALSPLGSGVLWDLSALTLFTCVI